MANRERGEWSLEIKGRVYTFRLTTASMAELEEACSTPARELTFPEILQRFMKGSAKYIALFVWATLREHHPTMTVKEASKLIDDAGGLVSFAEKVQQIVAASQPDAEDSENPRKAQGDGTGGASTSTPAKSA